MSTFCVIEICLPTINPAISSTETSDVAIVFMCSPSRIIVILSVTAFTSSNLCVMNMMPMFFSSANLFIAINKLSASLSVKTAVGSSNTNNLIPCLSTSLAISINCI